MELELERYPEYANWVIRVSKSTRPHYRSALKQYCEFTGKNPRELIDDAEEDAKRPRRERSITEKRLWEYLNFLEEGRGSSTTIRQKIAIVKAFYSNNGFPQSVKTPKAAPTSKEEKLRKEDVKKLVDHAPTLRDKAVILLGFQSGMDVSTVCNLKYGDVVDELEDNEQPMMLEIERPKTKIKYRTFLARDGIEKLKAYLRHRRRKFGKIKRNDKLFVNEQREKKEGEFQKPEGIKPHNIHKMMREIGVESGVVKKEKMESAKMNPCRFHALRKGFSSILQLKGINYDIIEGFLGHKVKYGGAYSQHTDEELSQIYSKASSELSISEIPEYARDQEKRIGVLERRIGDQRREIDEKSEEIEEQKKEIEELKDDVEYFIEEVEAHNEFMAPILTAMLEGRYLEAEQSDGKFRIIEKKRAKKERTNQSAP